MGDFHIYIYILHIYIYIYIIYILYIYIYIHIYLSVSDTAHFSVHPYNICGEAIAHLHGKEQSF